MKNNKPNFTTYKQQKNTRKREKNQEAKYGSFNMFIIVNRPLRWHFLPATSSAAIIHLFRASSD
jgi:hypothetical protein